MSLQDFINTYNGKGIDFDGWYGNQCVDLMNQYCKDVLGITNPVSVLGGDTAFHIYENYSGTQFQKIDNTPDGVPQPGDIVFWNTSVGTAGHVAVFVSGTQNDFTSFDQNWPQGSSCHEQYHNYNGVAGWLHPTQSSGTFVDAATFENLVAKSTSYDEFVKGGYSSLQAVTDKVNTLQSTIDTLNNEVGDLTNAKNDLESENSKVNAQAPSLADELAKLHTDDSNLGLRNVDLSHQLDSANQTITAHYKALQVTNETDYEAAIKALQAPHEQVVKEVQPIIDNLAEAAIYKKQPVKQPNPVISWIRGFLHL